MSDARDHQIVSLVQFDVPLTRHTVEPVLSVAVLLLFAAVYSPYSILDLYPALTRPLVTAALLVAPGILALSVLVGVATHVDRLRSGERTRPGDAALSRLFASVVLAVLALFTLGTVLQSLVVVFVFTVLAGGGLMIPGAASMIGSALAICVLAHAAFVRLFPEGPASRLRGSAVD